MATEFGEAGAEGGIGEPAAEGGFADVGGAGGLGDGRDAGDDGKGGLLARGKGRKVDFPVISAHFRQFRQGRGRVVGLNGRWEGGLVGEFIGSGRPAGGFGSAMFGGRHRMAWLAAWVAVGFGMLVKW